MDEERRERARLSRAEAEATLARLAEADDEVRAEPRDDGAGSGWHFDPVQRNANWRSPPEPSPPTERRLSDTEWGRALKGEIMAAIEERFTAERERNTAILAELIAGEPGQAPEGFAKDISELRSAICDVSKALAAWRSAQEESRAKEIDLPQLPRRRELN